MKKLTEDEKRNLKEGLQKLEEDKVARESKRASSAKNFGYVMGILLIMYGVFQFARVIGRIIPNDYGQTTNTPMANTAEAWSQKGAILNMLGNDDEALKCSNKALEIEPGYAGALVGKGIVFLNDNRHEEALECFDKVLEADVGSTKPEAFFSWHGKGLSLTHLGKYVEAVECFDRAIEIKPMDPTIWDCKGGTLFLLNRYEEAMECHDKALEIMPDFTFAYLGKGMALARLKRYEEARGYLTKFIDSWNPGSMPWDISGTSKANADKAIEKAKQMLEKLEQAEN